jgi:hypothetical protein
MPLGDVLDAGHALVAALVVNVGTEWMRVPCGAGAWRECDIPSTDSRRFRCLKKRIDANRTFKIIGRTLA